MSRSILHIDMDAFYASVEIRERPELAHKPVVVGGSAEERGVVSAANYIARRYGVHSAMASARARNLCPEAVFIRPRHRLYAEVSRQISAIFHRYTPLVEPLSLDEAFLDVTQSEQLFGPAEAIGRRIKREIRDELRLVASVGVAPNKFIAKLASDVDKPDGFRVVTPEQVRPFLDPLPVGRLWGVGKVTEQIFAKLGISTVGQLHGYPLPLLREHLGSLADHVWTLAQGVDPRPVVADHEARSISHETTFPVDIADRVVLLAWLLDLTEQVAARLRRGGLVARTLHLKVRYADFSLVTRSLSLPRSTDLTGELWDGVRLLFEQRLPRRSMPLRLIGMGVSGLGGDGPQQGDLLVDEARAKRARVDAVGDAIRERFGATALHRGAVDRKGPRQG